NSNVTIVSSDGVLFKVHHKNMEVHSDIFADAANVTLPENGADEVVTLSESSAVLDLLSQYMYHQPQPDLNALEFSIFDGLARAAQKYVVYSALPAVAIKMKCVDSVAKYPLQVLDYAARHNHKELANEAAHLSVDLPFAQAVSILAPDTLVKWVRVPYYHISAPNLSHCRQFLRRVAHIRQEFTLFLHPHLTPRNLRCRSGSVCWESHFMPPVLRKIGADGANVWRC
ncbi:hypothetical protein C8R44DRAFT_899377, partial [Mycena epipterygia]